MLTAGLVDAGFSSTVQSTANTWTAASLNDFVPVTVTASRTGARTCLVSWSPSTAAPSGTTYDVTDGQGMTMATGVDGTSTSITVPVGSVSPGVGARLGSWTSSVTTPAVLPCDGQPGAPENLRLTPSDGTVSASWSAPASNGGRLSSYTATITPSPGSGSATCTVAVPTNACVWSDLTNGLTYSVSVKATSDVGTGPAATETAVPYPSTVMTTSALKLWLDGADGTSLFASSGCTGEAATTTVGCWKDKSTSANNAIQPTLLNRPSVTTVSSRSVPTFDGASSWLGVTAAALPTGAEPSSTFIALRSTEDAPAAAGWRTALSWGTGSSARTRTYQKWNGSALTGAVTWSGPISAGGSVETGVTAILSDTWTSATYTGFWNGAPGPPVTTTTDTASTEGVVGAQLDGGAGWLGPIPEIVVVQGALTSVQRRSIEEYLARKWTVSITPAAPTSVSATAAAPSSTDVVVDWTPPSFDGGSPVTSYTATAVPTGGGSPVTCTVAPPAISCLLTGLSDHGTQYAVDVTATNAVGTGPVSSPAAVFSVS